MRRFGLRQRFAARSSAPLAVGAPWLAAALLVGLCGCADRLDGEAQVNDRSDDELVGSPCDEIDTYTICDDGLVSFCGLDDASDDLAWGACLEPQCFPGDDYTCGACVLEGQAPVFYDSCADPEPEPDAGEGGGTPLVLAFDDDAVELAPAGAATFDLEDASNCMTTDWPTAQTPWLALDRDESGDIDGGSELFGSGTVLGDGSHAVHGFEALAELDADGDGRITPSDPRFDELVLWGDANGDRLSTLTETPSVSALGVLSISLSYDIDPTCDARGNCSVEKATFAYLDRGGELRTGRVLDLHLSCH